MKTAQQNRRLVRQGNFPTSGFNFMVNGKAFDVMSSTIYTHKERAVIREVTCNAVDAHESAGIADKKVKVKIPTYIDPKFSVRDFGDGLADHEVRGQLACTNCEHTEPPNSAASFCHICSSDLEYEPGIYNTYFYSTKEEDEKSTGCLGLGTKSPFSVVDSFTVESYQNGQVSTYKCYINENKEPDVSLLTTMETDEPNGLKVSFEAPSKKLYKFEDEAINVLQWFKNVPEVNDQNVIQKIEHKKASYVIKGDEYGFTGNTGTTYAVMGNVAYEIPSEYIYLEGYIEFPLAGKDGIAPLSFGPGREQLSIDDHTENNLKKRIQRVKSELGYDMFKTIRSLPTKFERAQKLEQMKVGIFGDLDRETQSRLNFFKAPKMEVLYYSKNDGRATSEFFPIGSLADKMRYFRVGEDKSIRGYTMRIKDWVSGGRWNKVILLTPSQIKVMEVPDHLLEDLDDLPKLDTTNSSYARQTERVFTFKYQGWGCDSGVDRRRNWFQEDIDLNDGHERIYVSIKSYEPDRNFYSCRNLSDHIKKMERLLDREIIVYGVKKALTKQKQFKGSSFIEYSEWAKKKIEDNLPSVYYKQSKGTSLNNLIAKISYNVDNELFTEFAMYLDEIKNQIDSSLIVKFDSDIEFDYTIDNLYDEIIEKYPLINMISSSYHNTQLDEICNYIRMVDNEKVS